MLRRANPRVIVATLVAAVAVVGPMACSENDDPAPSNSAFITVEVSPQRIVADGRTADITVIATEADGKLGEGTITFNTTVGVVEPATATLANGRATAYYSCNLEEDSKCKGPQRINAEWKGVVGGRMIELITETQEADGGVEQDAGFEPDAGEADAGIEPDAGIPVELVERHLTLEASRNRIFFDVGDSVELTATLTDGDGNPVASMDIELTTTLGGLSKTTVDAAATSLTLTTNRYGVAKAYLYETGSVGRAFVTARHVDEEEEIELEQILPIDIVGVRQISWVSTKCNGDDCTIMGTRGSGFNEQAQVTFQVIDASGGAVDGMAVTFSIPDAPGGTTVAETGITDAEGMVTTNVSAGSLIGVFRVKAVVVEDEVFAFSPSIGIRGTTPANHAFHLVCTPFNIPAYVSEVPPADYSATCSVKLVDRLNNPVGVPTTVNFKVEAGAIPVEVTTVPYSAGSSNTNEGTAINYFSTIGFWPPDDVSPLPALPNQWPIPRDAEPSVAEGGRTRNPRDGLVTVLAYVRGEEYFNDDNQNGRYDLGETFIDQGEPFLDINDNGVRDRNEFFVDIPTCPETNPACADHEMVPNGRWDGPNGKYDPDTTIWNEAKILYTGRPSPVHSYVAAGSPPVKITSFGTLERGEAMRLYGFFPDLNLNRPWANTDYNAELDCDIGAIEWETNKLQDGYGFGYERVLVSAADGTACTPATPICVWTSLFYDWGAGYAGHALLKGDSIPDDPSTPPTNAPATAYLTSEVLDMTLMIGVTGIIE
ncbi:MAG: hypothetical protein ACOX6T_01680 [Myxococcales bacterium]|jgi:hypothetical protein